MIIVRIVSSITAQQAKLDLALVPKEKRLEIRKCNRRLNPGKKQREPTFQVVLDALALTPCYSTFLTTADVLEVYMHQFLDSIHKYKTSYRAHKKQDKMYYPRFTKFIVHYFLNKDKTISWRNKIKMHTSRDDYLINALRFVSENEVSQLYEARLPKYMKSPEMRETKAYKTYLGYATRAIPPKIARKFKQASQTKKDINLNLVPVDEEPKSAKKKVSVKKTTRKESLGVVLRDTPVESLSKKKEKVTVDKGKGIELLSEVALTEKAQLKNEKGSNFEQETDENETGFESDQQENEEEVKDDDEEEDEFVKSPSNYTPTDDEDETNVESNVDYNAEGDKDKGRDDTTNLLYDDVDIRLNEAVHAGEGQKEGTDVEMINLQQGNENLEITLDQVIEDAHVTISTILKKTEVPVTSSSHSSDLASKFLNFADIPPIDAEIVSPTDVHVHHEVPSNQTPTLLTVPVTVIIESSLVCTTTIPQSLPSFTHLPPLSKPTPPPTTEATNPISALLDFASVFRFNNRVSALEKTVSELRLDDPLKTQVTALVDEHLDSRLRATRDEFMSYLSESVTARITEQVKIQLPHILPEEILVDKIEKSQSYLTATEHRECYDGLIKSYELDKNRGLKKRKTSKDVKPTQGPKTKDSKSGLSKRTKSQSTSFGKSVQTEESEFEVPDVPQNQKGNLGNDDEEPMKEVASKRDWFTKPEKPQNLTDPDWNVGKTPRKDQLKAGTRNNFAELEYEFKECYKALSKKLDWDNPKGGDYPFDLTKPLLLVMKENHQTVPVDYFFNNDLKYLQVRISTMTYTSSTTKTKATQYDLLGIKDMVPNIWSLVKVAYDKHALLGISY
uniref:Retrovirus-related Pol polyprotein from transposon TNT 1-94 n=1 Tax=Tanacetum cinerariifolium TaxID=118510 RepID=A0A6L2NLV5_TANCI|nr:hypothetical protein [Tanacetum cinerariifolium]